MSEPVAEKSRKRDVRYFTSDQVSAFIGWAHGRFHLQKTQLMDWGLALLHEKCMEEFPDECPPIDVSGFTFPPKVENEASPQEKP